MSQTPIISQKKMSRLLNLILAICSMIRPQETSKNSNKKESANLSNKMFLRLDKKSKKGQLSRLTFKKSNRKHRRLNFHKF